MTFIQYRLLLSVVAWVRVHQYGSKDEQDLSDAQVWESGNYIASTAQAIVRDGYIEYVPSRKKYALKVPQITRKGWKYLQKQGISKPAEVA